ncbi:MAG: hypothetical protein QXI75_00710, partial [Candidatus Anstonellales archaeon]
LFSYGRVMFLNTFVYYKYMDSKTAEQKIAEMNNEENIIKVLDLNFNNNITVFENPIDALSGLNKFLSESNNQENQEELKRLEELLKNLLLNN